VASPILADVTKPASADVLDELDRAVVEMFAQALARELGLGQPLVDEGCGEPRESDRGPAIADPLA
jgi:hypothetical protein